MKKKKIDLARDLGEPNLPQNSVDVTFLIALVEETSQALIRGDHVREQDKRNSLWVLEALLRYLEAEQPEDNVVTLFGEK